MKKPRKLGQNSLGDDANSSYPQSKPRDVFTWSRKASSLVFFDEGTQSAQSFVPIMRNLV
jgi:hypothetical protein